MLSETPENTFGIYRPDFLIRVIQEIRGSTPLFLP
jgi:hypothetical protein